MITSSVVKAAAGIAALTRINSALILELCGAEEPEAMERSHSEVPLFTGQ